MDIESDLFVAQIQSSHSRILALKAIESLKKNNFHAQFFENELDAAEEVLKFIDKGSSVAFGGSQTVKQLNLPELISGKGAVILDHNKDGLSQEEKIEVMRKQQVCDIFLCSSNALTLDGEIYNIDGNGNRISAMIFGPRKVIILIGVNKICSDESSAWQRVKNISAPKNMLRLGRPNPCTKSGICMDCKLPTRGCNAYLVLRKKPSLTDISIFIVNKELGF
ncbi:MAG: lactate utilization protein [Bacteroidetes bacterium]|nr:lactate utilization protein [Bacteroidota bacterium]